MSFIGSANFKKRSFNTLGEFNALIRDEEFNAQLDKELNMLLDQSRKIKEAAKYSRVRAVLEEIFG